MTTIESRPRFTRHEDSLVESDQYLRLPGSEYIARQREQARRPVNHKLGVDSWERGEWVAHAECRMENEDMLFVPSKDQQMMAARCRHCPVKHQCRADALDNQVDYGVWGATTERERRSLLRRFPELPSWSKLLNPATRGAVLAEGVGDPEGALEALSELDANLERRFKRFRTLQIRHFKSVLSDIATRVELAGDEDDDTEIETMETVEALRNTSMSHILRD